MNITDYKNIFDYRGQSYNNAMKKHPHARHFERQALIDLLHLKPNCHVLDVPAGGGYLADGIQAQAGSKTNITCVEPSASFASVINPLHAVLNCAMTAIPLENAQVDVIASLAGMHHIEDRLEVFSEWFRVLKSGGQMVVADVEQGSGVDEFLNVFVNEYTPQGHDGIFFQQGEFTGLFKQLGMTGIHEKNIRVPWLFESKEDMCEFCMELFYLKNLDMDVLLQALEQHVGVEKRTDGKLALNWALRYAKAVKDK